MKKIILLNILIFTIVGCDKKKFFDGPSLYWDEFNTYSTYNDLFNSDNDRWSFAQLTNPQNSIQLAQDVQNFQVLRCFAKKSSQDLVSKASVVKQHMAYWEGETIYMSASFFIKGNEKLDWLFLMDIEEQTAIGSGPGMRLALVENKLRVEYKFNENDILQNIGEELEFPRDEWVDIEWEIKLSQKHKGSVQLFQNGIRIINAHNKRTLPKDVLYSLQGTKGMYSSFEVGITANSKDNDLELLVDNIWLFKH